MLDRRRVTSVKIQTPQGVIEPSFSFLFSSNEETEAQNSKGLELTAMQPGLIQDLRRSKKTSTGTMGCSMHKKGQKGELKGGLNVVPGEVDPLWVAKLIAHEGQPAVSTQAHRQQADQLVEGHPPLHFWPCRLHR